jgi:hypothetical protein
VFRHCGGHHQASTMYWSCQYINNILPNLIFCWPCIVMYHNNVTNLKHFHFYKVKIKAAVSGLYRTDACRHIVSLPLTEFTPSSPEVLHTKQVWAPSEGPNYILGNLTSKSVIFGRTRFFYMPQSWDMGHYFTFPPKEGMLWIFSTVKIRRLRSGANSRPWVPEGSMLTPRFTFTNTLLCRNPLHVSGVRRPSSGGTALAVFGVNCVQL